MRFSRICVFILVSKIEIDPYARMKAYGGRGVVAVLIRNIGTRWR
jgi:hypothetical protein